jgi:ribosomal-protein-alanine N-acetyltransferase
MALNLPPIQTARLLIRTVQASDLPDLLTVNGDDAVTQHLPYATWQSLEDGQAWLQRMQTLSQTGTAQQCVLHHRGMNQVVGTLLLFKHDEASARLEVGYVLGRACWGQGLMHEALRAVLQHALTQAGIRRVEAEVNPDNAPSCRLLQRLGFVLEGRARQRWTAKGHTYDTLLFGLLASDWPGAVL